MMVMSRPARDTAAAQEVGRVLTNLRRAVGNPPYERIARDIERLSGVTMSHEQARRFHVGVADPHTSPPEHFIGLAAYYDVGLSTLGPVVEERVMLLRTLLGQNLKFPIVDLRDSVMRPPQDDLKIAV